MGAVQVVSCPLQVATQQAGAGGVVVGLGVLRVGVCGAEHQVAVGLSVILAIGACHGVELVGIQFLRLLFGQAACLFGCPFTADVADAESVLAQGGVDRTEQQKVSVRCFLLEPCLAAVRFLVRADNGQQGVPVGNLHLLHCLGQVFPVFIAAGHFEERVRQLVVAEDILFQCLCASFGQVAVVVQPSFGRGIAVDVDALDLVGRIILHKLQGRIYLGQFAGIAIALGVEACLVDGVEEEGVALFTAGREGAGHVGFCRGLQRGGVKCFLLQYLLTGQQTAAVAAGHFLQQAEAGIVHPRLVGHGGVVVHQAVLLAVAGQYAIGIFCFRTVQSLGAVLDGP